MVRWPNVQVIPSGFSGLGISIIVTKVDISFCGLEMNAGVLHCNAVAMWVWNGLISCSTHRIRYYCLVGKNYALFSLLQTLYYELNVVCGSMQH